jgi:hypothetical protein
MCERVAEALGNDGDRLRDLLRTVETPSECADVLAAALVSEPDQRQMLLETLDPADRLDALLTMVGQLVLTISPGAESIN